MIPFQKISIWFLLLIGVAYLVLGLGALQLLFEWDWGVEGTAAEIFGFGLLILIATLRYLGLVFPIGVANIGFAAATTPEILVAAVSALIFGVLGIVGVFLMWRKAKFGFRIWQFLVALAIGVALWNWVWEFIKYDKGYLETVGSPLGKIPLVLPSSIWAILYYAAYRIVHRSYAATEKGK